VWNIAANLVGMFTETFQMLTQTYGQAPMSRTQCCKCFKRFKEGRISAGEGPRPGRPSTSTNDDDVETVLVLIRGNRRLTVGEFADEVGISIGFCHQIFTEKHPMSPVSAKFVPRLLTDDQKDNRAENSHELLANANGKENFLKNMKRGFIGVMLKHRRNRRCGWGKGLLDQKKKNGKDESIKEQGYVGCIFLLERRCPS